MCVQANSMQGVTRKWIENESHYHNAIIQIPWSTITVLAFTPQKGYCKARNSAENDVQNNDGVEQLPYEGFLVWRKCILREWGPDRDV